MLTVPLLRCGLRRVIGYSHAIAKQQLSARSNLASTAFIHLSAGNAAKLFLDTENRHAHSILEQSLKPYQIFRLDDRTAISANMPERLELPEFVLNTPTTTTNITMEELLNAFTELTQYCIRTNTCISDERFQQFCQLFAKHSEQLNDAQLLTTLCQLAQLPTEATPRAPNYMEIWNSLDIECCRRIERWSTNELLLACDAWYALGLARTSGYVSEALCKVGRKIRRLKSEQLVQSMFYCNLLRRRVYDMFDYEVRLLNYVDSMSLQELGVMSMGFFKTQTPIRNPELLVKLFTRLEAELNTVDDITLVAIIKVLRYSSKLQQVPHILRLLELLQAQVPRISLLSCLHVALFGVELQCCHDGVLELVLHRFNREIDMARLKDMERICLAMGVFNYRGSSGVVEELCSKILEQLETKIDEIMSYPRAFVCCLHYLVLCGHYKEEMISSVLDERFIEHAYDKKKITLGREIFNLDSFVKINLRSEDYKGNVLPDKMRRKMGKLLTQYIPERNPKYKLNCTDLILVEVKETFERIYRPCTFKHILPHFDRPDVVICYDNAQRKAVPLADSCPEDYSDILTRSLLLGNADRPEVDTVVIVIVGWNNVIKDKNRFTGLFEMKLQQLRTLGHKPVVIFWYEWRTQETPVDRKQFLQRKLTNVINF
ncbi:FAST kinase domain-containing protein 5, mitochondrial isoform X2 [Eurosta solidaginis]|uniref:FAST kinase domain-containing protein 5, mitochondrial isoform X2 n=1 Tax=Eurosta solidaginis TaxID=178769 RepID=UPI0035311310